MKKMKIVIITMMSSMLLASCFSGNTKTGVKVDALLERVHKQPEFYKERAAIFVAVKKAKDTRLDAIVNVSTVEPINIMAAISYADDTLSVSPSSGVDVSQKNIPPIKFLDQPLREYLKYLENQTGWSIELESTNGRQAVVYIRNVKMKTLHVQALSMSLDGGEDGASGSSFGEIVKQVNDIMNSKYNITVASIKPIVTSNQQLGIIQITGSPNNVNAAEAWVSNLVKNSNRQIHLQVQVLDVRVDESVGRGIDWTLIAERDPIGGKTCLYSNGCEKRGALWKRIGEPLYIKNPKVAGELIEVDRGKPPLSFGEFIDEATSQNIFAPIATNRTLAGIAGSGLDLIAGGNGTKGLISLGGKLTLNAMLKFLSSQGKVSVDNQPNITVTNGNQAYISTGDEFSYTAGSTLERGGEDNQISNEVVKVEKIKVGVDMKVLPKILPDNRIAINIVPVISSVNGFDELGNSKDGVRTPRIALQKLATQVIVESGRTIHLGGLIAEKVAGAAKGVPNSGVLDFFLKSDSKSLERREIVILITPTIVQ